MVRVTVEGKVGNRDGLGKISVARPLDCVRLRRFLVQPRQRRGIELRRFAVGKQVANLTGFRRPVFDLRLGGANAVGGQESRRQDTH